MKKICITGGAGFIASHLTDHFHRLHPLAEIIVIDKMGYAARAEYLNEAIASGQVRLVKANFTNKALMGRLLKGADLVVHAGAESHVDNSYRDLTPFVASNITGTINLLEAAVEGGVGLFFHVSTDEVYGGNAESEHDESGLLCPTNPYSASKASAEMFVNCFAKSYGLRTRMTRANNIYGTRQYPEKLIPKLICDAASGQRFQIQGQGTAQRSFLHVSDYCRAVSTILDRGEDGQIYNIPALREYTVLEVVDLVADAMGIDRASFTEFGPDRPHNDCRYGVVGSKLRALGWEPEHLLERDLPHLVEWYRANLHLYHDRPVSRPAAESELMVRYGLQAATLKPAPRSNRWDSQLGEVSRAG